MSHYTSVSLMHCSKCCTTVEGTYSVRSFPFNSFIASSFSRMDVCSCSTCSAISSSGSSRCDITFLGVCTSGKFCLQARLMCILMYVRISVCPPSFFQPVVPLLCSQSVSYLAGINAISSRCAFRGYDLSLTFDLGMVNSHLHIFSGLLFLCCAYNQFHTWQG